MELRSLPWVADGVDESEKEAAELLIGAARWYPAVFGALLDQPWVRDSITPTETDAIFGFRWMARYVEGHVDEVLAMPWAQDEITEAEGRAVRYLYYASRYVRPVADELLEKSWVQDDITADEATVIQNLYWTARVQDEAQQSAAIEAALRILEMPFLNKVSGSDAAALRSLERLGDAGVEVLLDVMSHPTILDGITDEEARIVALLGGTYSKRPESVDVLLRGTGVFVEERVVDLPLTGEVGIAIVRIRDQTTDRMDMLEHSVRSLEQFMDEPLPISYIALYFDDATTYQIGGTNFGSHIVMSLLYDVENGRLEYSAAHTIAHEVAHYYWGGSNQDWIDEGAAEFLGSISEDRRIGTAMDATRNPCASAETIGELEGLDAEVKTKEFRCNYSLGEAFFLDLYHALGEETFRQGFRNLYLKSLAEDYSDDCEGTDLGICHLVAAFKADASEADAAKVDEIVARWYGPLP